ncbi:MAG: cell wall hydrolase [Lachnospiraceae bacterium]|nr:cell wall hydrolase [Lachnospiraceae bacterium]
MRKRVFRIITSLTLVLSLIVVGFSFTSNATSVSELEQKKQQAINEKKNLEQQASDLHEDYTDVKSQYAALKAQVDEADISLRQASEELTYLSQQLSEAKTNQTERENVMKLHIRYMYENDIMNMIELLLESGSIAEFFERYEYLNMIVKYDRELLDEYKKTQQEITAKSEELTAKRTQLEAQSNELNAKKAQLKTLVDNAGAELSEKNAEVKDTEAEINAYDKKIAEMKEYEKQLAAQNASSNLALAREIGNFPNTEYTGGAYEGYTQDDYYLLACIIEAEAGGEPYEGKIAVGSVVMNRVFSSRFPNTIPGVVYQKNQFEPVSSGRLQLIMSRGPSADCYSAAQEVLNGARNTNRLFFWALWLAEQRGLVGTVDGEIIGSQFFF